MVELQTGAKGPKGRTKTAKTPVEGFELFITNEMMQDVVNNTNKNIWNFITRFHDVLKESSKYTYVEETDLIELKALIGLLYENENEWKWMKTTEDAATNRHT